MTWEWAQKLKTKCYLDSGLFRVLSQLGSNTCKIATIPKRFDLGI